MDKERLVLLEKKIQSIELDKERHKMLYQWIKQNHITFGEYYEIIKRMNNEFF